MVQNRAKMLVVIPATYAWQRRASFNDTPYDASGLPLSRPPIPPPYQRSIEIAIDAKTIRLIVTCVDEVLVDREQPTPAGLLKQLAQWLQSDHLSALPRQSNLARQPPKIGAGVHTLTIYQGQQLMMDASTAQFADQETAILSGDIESFANRLRQAIPHNAEDRSTP